MMMMMMFTTIIARDSDNVRDDIAQAFLRGVQLAQPVDFGQQDGPLLLVRGLEPRHFLVAGVIRLPQRWDTSVPVPLRRQAPATVLSRGHRGGWRLGQPVIMQGSQALQGRPRR